MTKDAIRLGGVTWEPFHYWDEDTDQIDGALTHDYGANVIGLDIWTAAEVLRWDQSRDWEREALAAWETGEVLTGDATDFGVHALILPGNRVGNRVREALKRFKP